MTFQELSGRNLAAGSNWQAANARLNKARRVSPRPAGRGGLWQTPSPGLRVGGVRREGRAPASDNVAIEWRGGGGAAQCRELLLSSPRRLAGVGVSD